MKWKGCNKYLHAQLLLLYFVILVGVEECWNIRKMISFKYFRLLLSVSSTFWGGLGADHTVFHRNWESVFNDCVPNGFYCALKSTSAKGIAQTNGECSGYSIFSQ